MGCEELLLFVFDFGRIFQRGVHVAVAVSVGDPLHGSGRSFAECDRSPYALDEQQLVLFA